MSYGNNQPRINTDRFGNAYQLKTLNETINKKEGVVIEGHFKGYVELGGKLYKIEVSPRLKETKNGGNAMWCKVTLQTKRQQAKSM